MKSYLHSWNQGEFGLFWRANHYRHFTLDFYRICDANVWSYNSL